MPQSNNPHPINPHHPNRLFRAMIVLSVVIHVGLFLHISGIYKRNTLTVIEMTVSDEFKPESRSIPRPRVRPKAPDTKEIVLPTMAVPRFAMEHENPEAAPDLTETPEVPSAGAEHVEGLSGLFASDSRGLFSKNDYYDMVRMKIEAARIYPEAARSRMIEGNVTVRFTVTLDGQTSSVTVAKSSGYKLLDQAAVKAVNDAAPFARPPRSLFKDPLKMEITLAFELT